MSITHRVNVNFSEGAYVTLASLAQEKGVSKAEILRDSIALGHWFNEARKEGGRILLERRDGSLREVIPR